MLTRENLKRLYWVSIALMWASLVVRLFSERGSTVDHYATAAWFGTLILWIEWAVLSAVHGWLEARKKAKEGEGDGQG